MIHDFAILKLASPILYCLLVRPVSIQTQAIADCSICHMAGWIVDVAQDQLTLAWCPVQILPAERCIELGVDIGETEVCFVGPTELSTITTEDDGSPIVCNGALVGMVVHPEPVGPTPLRSKPTRMARISYYTPWIFQTIDNF